jgi:1-acyl-sn-glycerol-3-phosphate acyltransferase
MRTILLLVMYVLIAVLAVPVLLICAVFHWLAPIVFIGKTSVRLGRFLLGVRLDVSGLEFLDPDSTYVYMPNHLSLLDGPLMFIVLPRFMRVIAKQELFRIPIFGHAMRIAEFIPVDRKGREGGKRAIQRAIRLLNEKRHSFLIFPEGTRSRNGRMQPFKRGGFYLAIESNTPIVPVSISGSFELMPKGAFFTKRGTIRVNIQAPISVDGYNKDTMPQLIEAVREAVSSGIQDSVNPHLVFSAVE